MNNKQSITTHIVIALCLSFLFGCDSRVENIIGSYKLITIDIEEQTQVAYDHGKGSSIVLIPETVFSIGFDNNYIVAKQHPKGNRSVINYWYLDTTKYNRNADLKESVYGPINKMEFAKMKIKLGLPDFTRTIKHLE